MRRWYATAAVGIVVASSSLALAAERRWAWSTSCGPASTVLEVTLDQRVVCKKLLSLCLVDAGSAIYQGQSDSAACTVVPDREIKWTGYREAPDVSKAKVPIEANAWQAGGEEDVILMGLSFVAPDRILMNTIHIVKPKERSETEIARGLVVATYPIPREEPGKP